MLFKVSSNFFTVLYFGIHGFNYVYTLRWKFDRDLGKLTVVGKRDDVEALLERFNKSLSSRSSLLEPTATRHSSDENQNTSSLNWQKQSKSASEDVFNQSVTESRTKEGSTIAFSSSANQFFVANQKDRKKRPGSAARVCSSPPSSSDFQTQLSLGSRLPSQADASSSQFEQFNSLNFFSSSNVQKLEEKSSVTKGKNTKTRKATNTINFLNIICLILLKQLYCLKHIQHCIVLNDYVLINSVSPFELEYCFYCPISVAPF